MNSAAGNNNFLEIPSPEPLEDENCIWPEAVLALLVCAGNIGKRALHISFARNG